MMQRFWTLLNLFKPVKHKFLRLPRTCRYKMSVSVSAYNLSKFKELGISDSTGLIFCHIIFVYIVFAIKSKQNYKCF